MTTESNQNSFSGELDEDEINDLASQVSFSGCSNHKDKRTPQFTIPNIVMLWVRRYRMGMVSVVLAQGAAQVASLAVPVHARPPGNLVSIARFP